jgi:hypothetical protein
MINKIPKTINAITREIPSSSQYQISNKNIFDNTIDRIYSPIVLKYISFFQIQIDKNKVDINHHINVMAKVV